MICPKCSLLTKHKYARTYNSTLKCMHCDYTFALDPKTMGFGDRRVLKVADKLSKGGRYFTEQQLACSCLLKKERSFTVISLIWLFIFGFFIVIPIWILVNEYLPPTSRSERLLTGLIVGLIFSIYGVFKDPPTNKIWYGVQKYCQEKSHPFLITPRNAKEIIDRLLKKDKLSFEDFHPDKALIVDDVEFPIHLFFLT